MFAKRTDWKMAQNELMARLEALQKEGAEILNLTESNPTRCQFSYPSNKILPALADPQNMDYDPTSMGALKAREAVSAYYQKKGLTVSAQNILLTASTSEAYSFLFRLLFNPSEGILVPRPSYPLFEFLAQLSDVDMAYYSLKYDGHWQIDFDTLNDAINSNIRAIVLVNPNNPTGSLITPQELLKINELCRQKSIALICDEVFLDYSFNAGSASAKSLARNDAVLTFTLGGLSKSMALPQMKLGWITASGPEKLVENSLARLEVICDTYLSVNTPVQNALGRWLELLPVMQKEILSRVMENYKFLRQNIINDCTCLDVQGGWYAVLRLPSNRSEEEWVMEFLEKDYTFVHPGYFFDFEDEPYIVMSLLPPAQVFKEGIKRVFNRVRKAT